MGSKIMLTTTPGYPGMSTMTPLVNNPYSVQQPSPDSQSFANMNLASPQHKQGNKLYMVSAFTLSIHRKVDSKMSSNVMISKYKFEHVQKYSIFIFQMNNITQLSLF